VPGAGGPARAARRAQQRPLVPARRHRGARHGPGLPLAARPARRPRLPRASAPARLEPQGGRYSGLLLPRPRRPPARADLVPARPFPADERANDLVHWQTRLVTDHDALEKLGQARPVAIPGHELGFARGVTVRDPDGHALEMVEP